MTTTVPDAVLHGPDLPIHPRTGLAAVGLVDGRPVWPILGGSGDDDDDDLGIDVGTGANSKAPKGGGGGAGDDEDDEDDTDDDGDEGDDETGSAGGGDDWKPPTKEEWERAQKATAKANSDARRYRREAREAKKARDTAAVKAENTGAVDDKAAARAAEEAEAAAMARLKPVAIRAAAAAALLKAKFRDPSDARISQMVSRLRHDDIDVDPETGEVDGLDDQIDQLAEDFPELFGDDEKPDAQDRARGRRPARINGANRATTPPEPQTTGERHVARLGIGPYAGRRR